MSRIAFIYVALGSAAGGVLRYAVAVGTAAAWSGAYPIATLIVNVVGSLVIGLLAGWLRSSMARLRWDAPHLLGMTGLCGGFTTFAFFSWDTFAMLSKELYATAIGYASLSVLLSLLGVWIGFVFSARYFLSRKRY